MTAQYEIWLCDDAGKRMTMLPKVAYFSYARTVSGYSNCTIGLAFDLYASQIPSLFQPDWRIDIWRSPIEGVPARREKSFFLRKYIVYQRQDGMRIIELFGRDAKDVLRRQRISSWPTAGVTDTIDNIMKYAVTNNLIGTVTVPTGELIVEGNSSEGPSVTAKLLNKNLLDALDELNDNSETLNLTASTNKVIYFDMIEDDSLVTNGFGYRFRTFATLRGMDRTAGLIFSVDNGNISEPNYFEDHLDAITAFQVFNDDTPAANVLVSNNDQYLSRWNYILNGQSSSETSIPFNTTTANTELAKARMRKFLNTQFVNSPGGPDQPRSLYGLDWDLGDLLPCKFGGKVFNAEVKVVYVSVNENGEETLTGRSALGE